LTAVSIFVRAAARRDIAEHYRWLRDEAGLDVAERFLTAIDADFVGLGESGGIGTPVESRHPRLSGLRKWRVRGFQNILMFYQPKGAGAVSIIRVLQAARDWWALVGLTE
jgi:toxin ParE1/3/4